MSTSTILISTPNIMSIKDCRQIMNYYANIKLSQINIPALRSDLSALAANLSNVDQNVNDILLKVNNVMDTSDIEAALTDLRELTGDVLASYRQDLSNTLAAKKKTLNDLREEVNRPTHNLKTMSYTNNTYRLKELEATRANLQSISKLEKDDEYYDVLLKRKQALDNAIEAYDSESFYDKALPIINQVDNIVAASDSPATFKKQMVKEGVQAVKHILKLADDAIKHDDMLTARITIIRKIMEREARNNDIDQQLKSNFDEWKQVAAFEELRGPKSQYIDEVEKILTTLSSFISVVYASSDTEEIANRFVENAPTLKAYALDLYPKWLRG